MARTLEFLPRPRHRWLALLAAGIIAVPVHAESDDPSPVTEPRRTVVFTPDRPERCDYFFVTEFNANIVSGDAQDAVDRFLFTDALGLMRNVGRNRALGFSIDLHLVAGAFRIAPTLRFKQWLAGRKGLELLLGVAAAGAEDEGVVGPIVDVRYSPNPGFHVQVGGCRIRDVGSIYYYPEYRIVETSPFRLHAGVGLGGAGGAIAWGVQAIGGGAIALLFAGMD